MNAAREKYDAVANFDAADIEAPIVYVNLDPGAGGADSQKKGSRWNALRHGCMAKVLFPADLEAEIEQCTAALTEHHQPTSAYEVGIIKNLGRLAAQIERLQAMKVIDLQRTMDRAVLCWDDDRDIYIDKLVERLAIDPMGVSRALCRSKQGISWLLTHWGGLISALENQGFWDEGQCRLALNLLGIPVELRAGNPTITPESDAAALEEVVVTELDRLDERLHKYIYAADDAERKMAAAGMPMEEDAQTKRLRKDDSRLRLEYRRSKAELLESRAQAAAAAAGPVPTPTPSAAGPAPAPAAEETGVASWTYSDPNAGGPKPRPTTSTAACNFLSKRSMLEGFEIQATATAPAKVVNVWLPFPGGDGPTGSRIEPEAECESEVECEPEVEPASLVDLDPVPPQTACVQSNAARTVIVNKRLDRERRQHRAQQKKARKAARRRR